VAVSNGWSNIVTLKAQLSPIRATAPAGQNHHSVSDRTDKAEKQRDKARHIRASVARCSCERCVMRTAILKARTSKDDQGRNGRVVQIGPMGSRHERMLWATRKIAHLTGAAEGGAYKRLLIALIEAEGRLDSREFKNCA
jgi:hypothetical protein